MRLGLLLSASVAPAGPLGSAPDQAPANDAADAGGASDASRNAYRDEVLADGPVAYSMFDDEAGGTAANEIDKSHVGTPEGSVMFGAAPLVAGSKNVDRRDDRSEGGGDLPGLTLGGVDRRGRDLREGALEGTHRRALAAGHVR